MGDVGSGQLRPWLAYAVAASLTAGVLIARVSIGPAPGDLPLLILFMVPVIVSAYLGGIGPGLLSTAIAALGTNYFLLAPIHSLYVDRPANLLQWSILIVAGALVSLLTEALHRSRRKALAAARSQKLEALGTLAGGIAHDFNNILLAINGNAQLALAELAEGHPARASIAEIAKAGARAGDLVRRILAFSRPQELRVEVLELRPVIEEALVLLRAMLPALIEIRAEFAADAPAVAADASQIHQIIVNLAANAAHAIGPRAGRIELRLEAAELGPPLVGPSPDLRAGRYCRLSMSDDGCGMDPATQQRIFDPFFTTKPTEGTGLGLSVVHGIMKGHQGAITVYSEPGTGSIFRLYFPAARGAPAARPAKRPPPAHGGSKRLLYIDDDQALVYLAERALGKLGYEITAYSDPARALADFRARPLHFDAIVTDLSMPQMSGFDLARELFKLRPGVPIIMTSGYLRPEEEEAARRLGIRELILKPDTAEELGRALDRLLLDPQPP